MANFNATEFKFNNESCYEYGLKISNLDGNGVSDNLSQEMNITTRQIVRRQKVYNYGVFNTSVMTFDMELYRETPIYANERAKIISWLSGGGKYGKLVILQDDLSN